MWPNTICEEGDRRYVWRWLPAVPPSQSCSNCRNYQLSELCNLSHNSYKIYTYNLLDPNLTARSARFLPAFGKRGAFKLLDVFTKQIRPDLTYKWPLPASVVSTIKFRDGRTAIYNSDLIRHTRNSATSLITSQRTRRRRHAATATPAAKNYLLLSRQ